MEPTVLVADDDPCIQRLLAQMLQTLGYRVMLAGSGEDALAQLGEQPVNLVLLDLNLPGMDGLEVLRRIRKCKARPAVVLISGSVSIEDAVEAMKSGACHCLTKPLSLKDLETTVREALTQQMLDTPGPGSAEQVLISASPAMREVVELVRCVSASPATTVLLTGETGTGKELIARELHRSGTRCHGPFVTLNCAALPAQLLESELFGHERGAFTDAKASRCGYFEEANGGTLFLDEIGELPLPLQAKLLRALQERVIRRVGGNRDIPIDVRVVAASNVDLVAAVEEGRFREDLFFRLSVIPIYVPPLRERKEAIIPLARHFCQLFARQLGRPVREFTEMEQMALLNYEWPGNVRELRNCIERAVLLDKPIDVGSGLCASESEAAGGVQDTLVLSLENPSLAEAERLLIQQVMARVNGDEHLAAELLGIHSATLSRKMDGHGTRDRCRDKVLLS